MAGQLLLGVDIGTYSAKGVLCTPEGEVLAEHVVEHTLSLPHPGWAEQDADAVWWDGFATICQALLSERYAGEDVGAVAVSAIGPCMLPVDEAGRPLRPGVLYGIDTRAQKEIDQLNSMFGEEAIYELGGMALTSQAVGPKILWLRNNEPDIYAKTHKIITATSYLVYRLTGEYVIDRHTGAHYNPLVNIRTIEWDGRFAEPIIPLEKLPAFRWSTDVVGQVGQASAAETGLAVGTPVTAGTVDAAAEAISVGVTDPGDLMVMYGTTMFFIQVTDRPMPDERVWSTGYVLPGTYDIAGGMSTTGALTRWFRDNFAGLEMRAETAGGENAYAALAKDAADIPPGSNGLICLPYFSGERTPINDPDARGVFAGLTLSHSRAHMYRAMLEGTGQGVRHNIETLREMGADPKRIVAVGGGAKNREWLQIVSDCAGVPQVLPERTIGASFGDAFIAGLATGIIPDISVLRNQWVKVAGVIEPNPAHHAVYDQYFGIYRGIYENAKEQLHELAALQR